MPITGDLLNAAKGILLHGGNANYYSDQANHDTSQNLAYPDVLGTQNIQAAQANVGVVPAQAPPAANTGPYDGSGGGAYDPNTDAGLVAQARGQVSPLIAQLQQLYGSINSSIDAYGQDKRGQLDTAYNTNLTNNTNSFNKAYNTTNGVFTARGAADSSYLGNAQQGNKDDYNAANTNTTQGYNDNLDQLGSVLASNKAAVANVPQYDLSAYSDVNSLLGLRDALDTHISSLNGQKANLLTSGQLKGQLDSIAPSTSTLDTTLKARLDALAGSGAPADAQYGLGQGYIDSSNMSKTDKDKWTTYLSTVLSGSGNKSQAA